MKTNIHTKIESLEQAENYLKALVANDEVYHPEDDAHHVIFVTCEVLDSERQPLNDRMAEVYEFMDDPCLFLCELDEKPVNNNFVSF